MPPCRIFGLGHRELMGLLDFVVGKVADGVARVYLETNSNYRYLVDNGYCDKKELKNEIMGTVQTQRQEQVRVKQVQAQAARQKSIERGYCTTCKHFSWGECWYYYEGHPGYNPNKVDEYGNSCSEPIEIFSPETHSCSRYERDWNK